MNTSYLALLAAIAPTFVALACGFTLRRLGKLQPAADASLLTLAVNFLYPCLIADTVLGNPALRSIGNVIAAPIAGACLLACSFAVAALAARALRLGRPQPSATFTFTAALPNWGYLPIPIIQSLYGERTTGVLFVHNIGLELTLWSLGIWILSGERSWRRVLNIPFFAILSALFLNLAHAGEWLPGFALKSLSFLGQAAIPLSLLLAGATLADALAEGGLLHHTASTLTGCAVRLLILPPLVILAARWLPCSVELKRVLVVQAAMPCALIPVILARYYRSDSGTAVRIVIGSTILGLLTIPMWMWIGERVVDL
jgi:predicted permease